MTQRERVLDIISKGITFYGRVHYSTNEQVGAVSHEERVCGQKQVCPCGCVRSK